VPLVSEAAPDPTRIEVRSVLAQEEPLMGNKNEFTLGFPSAFERTRLLRDFYLCLPERRTIVTLAGKSRRRPAARADS
jgi:hypothetical protein